MAARLLSSEEKKPKLWYDEATMPFLTRDFAVFLGLVAFLLAGITATGVKNFAWGTQEAAVVAFADDEAVKEYRAVAAEGGMADSRVSRVKELTEKVGEALSNFKAETLDQEPTTEAAVPVAAVVEDGAVLTCAEYARISPAWSAQGLKFDVVEGALLVYRERTVLPLVTDPAASTTVAIAPSIEREVVLQLPARMFASPKAACIATDVIGIALDGSLIRNGDYTAYGVFGSETLVGYALDGFAIYGQASFATDSCGGSDTSGEYRYYLSDKREGVLGCFSATPISL